MSKVATLTADLVANTTKFEEGMKRATKSLVSFQNIFKVAFGTAAIENAMDGLVNGLKAITTESFVNIDATSKMAKSLGIAIDNFQAFALVADEAGVEQEALGALITKSQKVINDAAQGNKKYAKTFQALGVDINALIRLAPDEQFDQIAQAISGIENPTQRTAVALEIFGKQGRSAIALFEDFKAKSDEAREFNRKFNIELTQVDANKVEEANDTFARLGKAIGGLGNTIAVYFAPLITDISNYLLDAGVDGETFSNALVKGMEKVAGAIDYVRIGILGLRKIFLELSIFFNERVIDMAESFYNLNNALQKFGVVYAGYKDDEKSLINIGAAAQGNINSAKNGLKQLENEAAGYKKTLDVIEESQIRAGRRNAKNRPAVPGNIDMGLLSSGDDSADKQKKKLDDIVGSLKEENQLLEIRNALFGQSEAKIDKFVKAARIQNDLDREGIKLTDAKAQQLADYLGKIEKQTDLLKRQEKQQEKLKEKERDREQALNQLGATFESAFEKAITGGEKLGDVLEGLAQDIIKLITRLTITEPLGNALTDMFKGTGGGGGIGGFFSSIFGSFATGISNVPYDMTARLHRGETVMTRQQSEGMARGGDVKVTINNNGNSKVSTSSRETSSGTELLVTIDQVVADNLANPSTRTGRTMRALQQQGNIRR